MGLTKLSPILCFSYQPRQCLLDVNCGVGGWLAVLVEQGISDCFGIDGAHIDRSLLWIDGSRFLAADLAGPLDLQVMSPDDLATLASSQLWFQVRGGAHHINEQGPTVNRIPSRRTIVRVLPSTLRTTI